MNAGAGGTDNPGITTGPLGATTTGIGPGTVVAGGRLGGTAGGGRRGIGVCSTGNSVRCCRPCPVNGALVIAPSTGVLGAGVNGACTGVESDGICVLDGFSLSAMT